MRDKDKAGIQKGHRQGGGSSFSFSFAFLELFLYFPGIESREAEDEPCLSHACLLHCLNVSGVS